MKSLKVITKCESISPDRYAAVFLLYFGLADICGYTWAGYSFSADYSERRGHAYMLEDQTFTARQKFNPPAMCINCHASLVTTFLKLGDGDLIKGFNVISHTHMTYSQIREHVKHPVTCIDWSRSEDHAVAHHPPGIHRGNSRLKASQGVPNYDVNTMATRQEMRSFVCGQCHVTYYFQPPNKRLTFPWAKGLKVENIITVEDEQKIKEWDHPDSGAGLIKAHHPEFEMWNQGVHARSGVACAGCHMPYMRQGGSRSAIIRSTARCSRSIARARRVITFQKRS